ncbi:MAG: FeoA domain-containing protein [Ignavibacteria bacterium]
MSNPLILILLGLVLIFVAGVLFWPGKGFFAKRKKYKWKITREFIEDALKHLYDCEYKKINCSVNSIAGNLSIGGDQAAKLIARLEAMGLIKSLADNLQLTPEGRSYALRVIRIHRLWERYLADETSIGEADWHNRAEEQEHVLTEDEANYLAAQLSNPVYDPHGDPIPTASGELPVPKGKSLISMANGESAQIIHIEDEPPAVFAQLAALGLYPGVNIRMIDLSKDKIRFAANGEECILAPIFANNVTVAPMQERDKYVTEYRTLSSLEIGEDAVVIGISKACRGQQRRRLMDLGVVPGSKITAELKGVGGDPVAYNIRGATIALRKEQAKQIYIKVSKEEMAEA